MGPFLKWAGGKRWMVGERLPALPAFDRYIEPFLGGGAVFFALKPERAILSDVNGELISLYKEMRDNPSRLYRFLEAHHAFHSPEHYYEVREWEPSNTTERAARMLYLNRTCWNGLYRVNKRGKFNVPIGTKSSVIFDEDDFQEVSRLLSGVDLRACDFGLTLDEASGGDLAFIDPPYTVKHNMNGFVKYNETMFSWADQIRLRDAVAAAIQRGVAVIVTNADHQSVRDLYEGVAAYQCVGRASVLAGSASRRGKTTEAMFLANI